MAEVRLIPGAQIVHLTDKIHRKCHPQDNMAESNMAETNMATEVSDTTFFCKVFAARNLRDAPFSTHAQRDQL